MILNVEKSQHSYLFTQTTVKQQKYLNLYFGSQF